MADLLLFNITTFLKYGHCVIIGVTGSHLGQTVKLWGGLFTSRLAKPRQIVRLTLSNINVLTKFAKYLRHNEKCVIVFMNKA